MYVTDTHPLIWYIQQEYKRLSRKVKCIFDQALVEQRVALVVPTAVLWELSLNIKADPGNIQLAVPYKGFLARLFQIPTVIEEPITKEIVALSHDLQFHNDGVRVATERKVALSPKSGPHGRFQLTT